MHGVNRIAIALGHCDRRNADLIMEALTHYIGVLKSEAKAHAGEPDFADYREEASRLARIVDEIETIRRPESRC